MLSLHTRTVLSLALAFAVLSGQLTDLTTGQPLSGVNVKVSGPSTGSAISDRNGRFKIAGLKAGNYSLRLESADVPVQSASARLRSGQTLVLNLKLCSSTLDYHCGSPGGGGG
jgi:hypothetical protein